MNTDLYWQDVNDPSKQEQIVRFTKETPQPIFLFKGIDLYFFLGTSYYFWLKEHELL